MTPPEAGYYWPQRQLVSQAQQSMIERPDVPRSKFSGTWTEVKSFDAGYLVPFLLDEVLPGDHMKYDATAYVRMATPLFPLFTTQRVETFFFFVPARLLWTNWRRFMGEQVDPLDSIAYTIPQIVSPAGGFAQNGLYDHFGVPTAGQITGANTMSISALPLRAYYLIWSEWFRDQNLQVGISAANFGDGPDLYSNYQTQVRSKLHDYFTSCLPWPQKFVAPTVSLGASAPVRGLYYDRAQAPSAANAQPMVDSTQAVSVPPALWQMATQTGVYMAGSTPGVAATDYPVVYADLSLAAGISINTLRQAWLVQQLLERDARGGTRYTEIVKSHFGVSSPDMRLQRPEYIGGGSQPLTVTPIAQTATGGAGLGSLGAAATAVGQHHASYASTEHGYVIGIINVRTELAYQQGLHRMWTRSVRTDFYFPSLAGLGEQFVRYDEIYCLGTGGTTDTKAFGYQERWQEYRTRYSSVTGVFRSTATGTLDAWHLAQKFTALPTLNQVFIFDTPPMSRVLAAGGLTTNQQYYADIMIRREATRPLPVFGTPVTLGRF